MKILVAGGTGMIGARLVERLRRQGHDVVAAARSTGVDIITGVGLDAALEGIDAVVDTSNSGYFDAVDMQHFFEASGATLLTAARNAGIRHHVTLSAIGVGRLDRGYFRAKGAQEEIAVASGIPFTIVRATPFYEYIYNLIDEGGDGGVIHLPPIFIQPIAADDVADALLRVVLEPPINGVVEIAGPDTYRLPALGEEILTANEDTRAIVADRDARYFCAQMDDETLIGRDQARLGATLFDDWLRQSLAVAD
jgi:uncharacterized protein YbjT (DUF2867 family)